MPFKVETKPTLWWVQLSQGSYSDYTENNYYIRANDKDEAWYLFKQYWRQTIADHPYSQSLQFEQETYNPTGKRRSYGDWDVDISNLDVIEFHK